MLQKISSRQHQIFNLLLENRDGLSIDEIANTLDISRTAVQQHFSSIENEGYIKKDTLNKTTGRPVTLYVITDKGINTFPKQYAWFSELILTNLLEELGPEPFKNYMEKLGTKVAEKLQMRFAGKNIEQRMDELILVMSDLGYQVRGEQDTETDQFNIRAHNCVYHDLAMKHQEICAFDLALMSNLLNQKVKLVTCMAKGGCACNFRVKKPSSTTS